MALLTFWKSNRELVLTQTIQQIVTNAGDGKLRDGSECARELRAYLGEVPSEKLYFYAKQCLDDTFNESGLVLQDIINEMGRRLDFSVENGLYRGKKTAVGYDGIWRSLTSLDMIIEVKTTDYITLSLEKIARYKGRLVEEGKIAKDACILIVVGREDTGALEAQIRGSRYAWDMRLISVERLGKLLQIKEKSNDDATVRQIRELLQPFEYTKIDKIIDVIFSTAEDVEQINIDMIDVNPISSGEQIAEHPQSRTPTIILNRKRQKAIAYFEKKLGVTLLKQRETLFLSPDRTTRVCAAVSKNYNRLYQPYWYAYHPAWNEFLKEGKQSFFILACMDKDEAYALPYNDLKVLLDSFHTTERPDGKTYWHLAVTTLPDDELALNLTKIGTKIPLAPYRFPLKEV